LQELSAGETEEVVHSMKSTKYPGAKALLQDERGMLMVFALVIMLIMSAMGGVYLITSGTEQKIAFNEKMGTDVFYVAETGWNYGIYEMSNTNFQGITHESDGETPVVPPTLSTTIPYSLIDNASNELDFDDRNNGDWVWQWTEDKPYESLTGSGLHEQIRLRVYFLDGTDPPQFVLKSEGTVGKFKETLEIKGFTEPLFNYSIFDAGDLSEFVRGEDQEIYGKIHANGNIFYRPTGTTLRLASEAITCGGDMIRSRDAWDRPHESGTVLIKDGDDAYQEMGTAPFYDHSHPDWTDNDPSNFVEGALERWDGIVRDRSIGGHVIEPPAIKEDGYYDQYCDIRIMENNVQDNEGNDISSVLEGAISTVEFFNPGMNRYITVREVDMAKLRDPNEDLDYSDSNYPANGLIFSSVPLRLKNANELDRAITIVSTNSIYTWGNFNNIDKKPAALISRGRLWHLSENWDDSKATLNKSERQACDTEIYAALVDGVPTVDEANYVGGEGDCWPNSDDLLEYWGGSRTLMKRGSIVHLQNANMCDPLVNDPGSDEIGWRKYNEYQPPHRDYGYDADLASPINQPPFIPYGGHIFSWREVH
jgi:hypothetical protein